MYNIIYEMSCQSRFDPRYWMFGAGALGRPRGMAWGGRREEGSGWGTHVYLWRIHFDIWQNQYNIVKIKNKIKFKKKKQKKALIYSFPINFHYFDLSNNTPTTHLSISKSFQGYSILLVDVGNETNIDEMLDVFFNFILFLNFT